MKVPCDNCGRECEADDAWTETGLCAACRELPEDELTYEGTALSIECERCRHRPSEDAARASRGRCPACGHEYLRYENVPYRIECLTPDRARSIRHALGMYLVYRETRGAAERGELTCEECGSTLVPDDFGAACPNYELHHQGT